MTPTRSLWVVVGGLYSMKGLLQVAAGMVNYMFSIYKGPNPNYVTDTFKKGKRFFICKFHHHIM